MRKGVKSDRQTEAPESRLLEPRKQLKRQNMCVEPNQHKRTESAGVKAVKLASKSPSDTKVGWVETEKTTRRA